MTDKMGGNAFKSCRVEGNGGKSEVSDSPGFEEGVQTHLGDSVCC
jgi:hypothetical protein